MVPWNEGDERILDMKCFVHDIKFYEQFFRAESETGETLQKYMITEIKKKSRVNPVNIN